LTSSAMKTSKFNTHPLSAKLIQSIHSLGNAFLGDSLRFSNGKIFSTKRSHRSTVHECHFHVFKTGVVFSCQIAHQSSGEGISRSGRIGNLEQRQGRGKKHILVTK